MRVHNHTLDLLITCTLWLLDRKPMCTYYLVTRTGRSDVPVSGLRYVTLTLCRCVAVCISLICAIHPLDPLLQPDPGTLIASPCPSPSWCLASQQAQLRCRCWRRRQHGWLCWSAASAPPLSGPRATDASSSVRAAPSGCPRNRSSKRLRFQAVSSGFKREAIPIKKARGIQIHTHTPSLLISAQVVLSWNLTPDRKAGG